MNIRAIAFSEFQRLCSSEEDFQLPTLRSILLVYEAVRISWFNCPRVNRFPPGLLQVLNDSRGAGET
jgi:hypothetical protein